MPVGSEVLCPDQVGDLVRAGITPSEFEGLHFLTCLYAHPYVDERVISGSLSATWYDNLAATEEGQEEE